MLQEAIRKFSQKESLTKAEAYSAMDEIMKGQGTKAQIGAFLMALNLKGETIDEITGCAEAMRKNAAAVKLKSIYAIDTCGTGGDGGKTFNVSTAAAIVAAAAGVKVAKHGNRSVSSPSGSADVLTELGVSIDLPLENVPELIENTGMAFLFAPRYHTAMKYVASDRKELGIRTIFNILGPITNPAYVKGQVLGVFKRELTDPIAHVLLNMGTERALVVHGSDGLDEITTTGITYASEVRDGKVISQIIEPGTLGIKKALPSEICGGTPKENAKIILDIFSGTRGPKRDLVVLNSAAALYVGKACESLKEGVLLSERILDEGLALNKLNELRS